MSIRAFVYAKQKTVLARNLGDDVGDSWTWFAIDADSKLLLSHKVGKRDEATCSTFLTRLNNATTGRTQVTSDGSVGVTHIAVQ
jgi:IS1 family transposase